MPKGNLIATIGIDVAAYVDVEVPPGTDTADAKQLLQFACEVQEHMADQVSVDWQSANALRVVSVRDPASNRTLQTDVQLSPSYYTGGVALQDFLTGRSEGLQDLVNAAADAKLVPRPHRQVAYTGNLQFPGAEMIDVEFTAREGATQTELDLIFLQCLAQIATVNYLAVGDDAKSP